MAIFIVSRSLGTRPEWISAPQTCFTKLLAKPLKKALHWASAKSMPTRTITKQLTNCSFTIIQKGRQQVCFGHDGYPAPEHLGLTRNVQRKLRTSFRSFSERIFQKSSDTVEIAKEPESGPDVIYAAPKFLGQVQKGQRHPTIGFTSFCERIFSKIFRSGRDRQIQICRLASWIAGVRSPNFKLCQNMVSASGYNLWWFSNRVVVVLTFVSKRLCFRRIFEPSVFDNNKSWSSSHDVKYLRHHAGNLFWKFGCSKSLVLLKKTWEMM